MIEAVAERSELVRQALEVAQEVHAGTVRDVGEEVPFVEHPLTVAELLAERGLSDEVLAAGLLHDSLEYTNFGLGKLRERFGMRVALIVCALTEDLEIEVYEERKEEHRERVAATGAETQRVFAADKIANVMATREAYEQVGEEVDLGLPVELDRKILAWEYDMEMLFEAEEGEPLFMRLSEELLGLWEQRCS
jgi:(p)ppGpp synthase/HD superfamily hydrolase